MQLDEKHKLTKLNKNCKAKPTAILLGPKLRKSKQYKIDGFVSLTTFNTICFLKYLFHVFPNIYSMFIRLHFLWFLHNKNQSLKESKKNQHKHFETTN